MLAKDIYITFPKGKTGYVISNEPLTRYGDFLVITEDGLNQHGVLTFSKRQNCLIRCNNTRPMRNRRGYCLVTVHFGTKGWYVFDRKSDCFLLEDGKLTPDDVFYAPTRAAARELIKRYFQ